QIYNAYAGMEIGDAITAAAADTPAPAAATPYTIKIGPGSYSEAITGSAYLSLIGESPNNTIITQVSGDLVTLGGIAGFGLENLTLQLTAAVAADALIELATGANTLVVLRNLIFDLTGAAAGNAMYAVNSDAAFAHTVALEECKGSVGGTGVSAFVRDSAGTLTATMRSNTLTMNSANGFIFVGVTTVVTVYAFEDSYTGTGALVSMGAANHRIVTHGGAVDMDAASTHGAGELTTWKTGRQQYEVNPSFLVQHAITAAAADTPAPAAAAPYTVLIHPGVYAEVVACSAWVNLKGMDRESVIVSQTNADVITLASNVVIEDLTVRITTPDVGAKNLIDDGAAALTGVFLRNLALVYTTPAAIANVGLLLTGGSTVVMERCSADWAVPGTGAEIVLSVTTAASTVLVDGCNFRNTNVTAGSLINSAFAGTVITVVDSRLAGTVTHLAASAGIIRIANSQYRSVVRTGTGNIVDEDPDLKDAPWHVMNRGWESLDAYDVTGVVGGGVIALGGSGQVALTITNAAIDVAGICSPLDVANSLESSWKVERTPRYLKSIGIHLYGAGANGNRMFFGLRETIGNAVPDPAGAEEYAGFDWDGTDFRAVSSDGGGVGVQTAVATDPIVDVHHQLEVIIFSGVQVEFYVDGVLVATHSAAAGLPNAATFLDWQELIHALGTGAAAAGVVTVRRGGVQECPA
ncbi:MAG: hypothetical protein ABIH46_07495, partial [Chloroflexota bacterium]